MPALIASTSVWICCGLSVAQGNDPRPPASDTAMAIALSVEPAIGACTIGTSMPRRSVSRFCTARTVRRAPSGALRRALLANRLVGQTSGVTSTKPASRQLAHLRAPDVVTQLSERSIVVQPLGAIEQHGPHLPLHTDLLIAESVAVAAVARVGDELDVWLLPPLAYTKSDEHAWSPGTIWLSTSTMLAVLDDIGRCVSMTPARRLVSFNGHGGNSALLAVANRELRRKYGVMTFLAHPSLPPDQGGASTAAELGFGVHAGADETSLVLHLAPELVDLSVAIRGIPEHLATNRYVRFGGAVSFGWLSNDFNDDGVIGDPAGATAERGAELFAGAVDAFCDVLGEIADFAFRTHG